ncbi:MAG: J domain-containing protein [Deltaproteobacteria bacterium]|nr:J domain-containing protein [Deltaproteobacteria bacterium]MBW2255580.1 J domain-containing protein [Deltaproteobacteria bacterium]
MRQKAAQRLTSRDFLQRVAENRFAIVRVDTGLGVRFNPEVIAHFDRSYPRQFLFGVLDRSRISSIEWWQDNFRTPYGPLKRGMSEPENGYYLFEYGAVSMHLNPPAYVDILAAAKQVIAYFEQRVSMRAKQEAPRSARQEPAPMAPRTTSDRDPFEVLGVSAEASDDEIRQAYREQMKLNHPDKVAHLSPAIREVAAKQTVEIQLAYEAIRAMRRGSL